MIIVSFENTIIQQDPKLREDFPFVANLQDLMKTIFGFNDMNQVITELTRQLGRAAGQLGNVLMHGASRPRRLLHVKLH